LSTAPLLIVGGGPAGMSTAIAAAKHGIASCIIDEGRALGGQIYREPHTRARTEDFPYFLRGDELRAEVRALNHLIEVRSETVVWGISKDGIVAIGKEQHGTDMLEPEQLILAPGAYEYTVPFPGWTIPGVMTPGSAQIMAKTMAISPGKRVVIGGTGPLIYVVASQLVKRGVNVVAVLEATRQFDWWRLPAFGWRAHDVIAEGLGYLRTLRQAGVPLHYGRVVTRAEGTDELTGIVHAPVDKEWVPDLERAESIDADTLCVGYGLQPRNYLAQLAGCDIEFDRYQGGWRATRDADMCTSKPKVFAVGDGAGVAGAATAELEGTIAGLVCANRLGGLTGAALLEARKPAEAKLNRLAGAQQALGYITRIRPGISQLVEDDTIVCRCEEVKWNEVKAALEHGGTRFRTLKVMTRFGMGMCQARYCWPAMARKIALEKNTTIEDTGPVSPRPPIRPVSIDVIAAADASRDDNAHG
jgi:NADPH-dependent 2,4-dienoyl-CoA reductase/sulfur reductase-like enzyme